MDILVIVNRLNGSEDSFLFLLTHDLSRGLTKHGLRYLTVSTVFNLQRFTVI
jgi:hypothetical protein